VKITLPTSRLDPAGLRLPLIALIDVMLFLLIYFMVAGSLAAEEGRLAAALRGTGGSGPVTSDLQPQVLNVESADGRAVFRLGDRVFEERRALYQALLQLPAEVGITVRVADQASVAAVAAATQVCRDAGFQKLSYLPAKKAPE
jgi:biopolymer transport protein ExbD